MRILTAITFVACLTIGYLYQWHPMLLPNSISSELHHWDVVTNNTVRMRDDLSELLRCSPTWERLLARAYVARALYSCDYAFMAFPEEIEDFSAAIRLDPKYARAYVLRGCAVDSYYRREPGYFENHMKPVIADYEMVIQLDPKSRSADVAYSSLATKYACDLHQRQKSIEICNLAIANLPEMDAKGHYHARSYYYRESGEQQKALHDLRMAESLELKYQWADRWSDWMWQFRWVNPMLLVFLTLWLWCGRRFSHGRALAP